MRKGMSGPTYPLLGILAGRVPLDHPEARQQLTIEGDEARLVALIDALPLIPADART